MQTEQFTASNGRTYLARGWLNGINAPVGTILGPNTFDEYLTVVAVEPGRVRVAHTRPEDFKDLQMDTRSVCEHMLFVQAREVRR
jgi:hypothetical protein